MNCEQRSEVSLNKRGSFRWGIQQNPLPKCTCHKKPNWNGSLMKTNILCNPQGGNDYKWGVAHLQLAGFPEKECLRTEASVPAWGHEEESSQKEEPKVVPGFSVNSKWLGKHTHCGMYRPCSPTPLDRCFLL